MPDLVTVVVPTRNNAETLRACLESVRGQTHPEIEVVVVDNGSSDATVSIGEELADAVLAIGPERSAQRNAGARHGRGSYLLFIDSDMVLEPEVIAQAVADIARGCKSVVIPEESFGEGFWTRVKAYERSFYLGDDTVEAARFFSREAFDAVGGYDEEIVAGPEDWDIHVRVRDLGAPVGRTVALIHHDEGHLRLRETMATKYYYGKSTAAYLRKHPQTARMQLKVVRPAFLRDGRKLRSAPHLAVAMIVMKVLEMGSGAAGLLVTRWRSARA